MHEDDVDTCTRCLTTKFRNLYNPAQVKHHCRFCGYIVCNGCSKRKRYYEPAGANVRCCDTCHAAEDKAALDEASKDGPGGGRVKTPSVYEFQRHNFGWKPTKVGECLPYKDGRTGEAYALLEAVKPEPGCKWLSLEWAPSMEGDVDANGWQYAGAMWDKGLFNIQFTGSYNRLIHYTRRRKLIRKMETMV